MAETAQTPAPLHASEASLLESLDSVPVFMKAKYFSHFSVEKMLGKRLSGLSKSKLETKFWFIVTMITDLMTKG